MRKRVGVETLETVELRGQGVTTRVQGNGGGEMQRLEHGQCGKAENERDERDKQGEQGAALAVLLGQMVAYLSGRVDANDLDIVGFSLHHLFCSLDSLYRTLLPSFVDSLATEMGEELEGHDGQLRPLTWVQLQDMRQMVRRMQPLCQLLSEAGEGVLGQLGYGQESAGNEESEEREEHEENREEKVASAQDEHADEPRILSGKHEVGGQVESEQDVLFAATSAGIEQALKDLTASLTCWQQHYCNLPSFRSLLYALFPTIPLPFQPEAPFTHLLDGASTLFSDILPAFHALSHGDDDVVIQLLLDLLQQVDLLAVECETLLQLFHLLLQQHTLASA